MNGKALDALLFEKTLLQSCQNNDSTVLTEAKLTKCDDTVDSTRSEYEKAKSRYRNHSINDKENIKWEVVSVPITPVKLERSKYLSRYKSSNTESWIKTDIKSSVYKSSFGAKKSLNFSNKNDRSSDLNIEDFVVQAQNPNLTPKPSHSKNRNWRDLSVMEKPLFDNMTNGYLGPKLERDVGKKTLVNYLY